MSETTPPPVAPPVQTESKGRNCWVVGCSGCLIALLLAVLVIFAGVWWVRKTFLVEPFEPVEISQAEAEAAEEKLKTLNLLDESGQISQDFEMPAEGLLLTETEVNYWISQQDQALADSVRLDFEPDQIRAELRWAEPGNNQRWNLSGAVSLKQTADGLDVRLLDLRMGGIALPASIIEEISGGNLAQEIFTDPQAMKDFDEKVQKIEVQKDRILLIPKH